MKLLPLIICLGVIGGCGSKGSDVASGSSDVKTPAGKAAEDVGGKGKVTQEQIQLPFYPGATEVAYTGVVLHSEVGDTYSVGFESKDSAETVYEFYKTECAKVGRLADEIGRITGFKVVSVTRPNGTTSAVRSASSNGVTHIVMHTFVPKPK